MKKILVLLAALSIALSACGNELEYDIWKDTVEAFGNGNYQILHSCINDEDVNVLHNCKHNQGVMTKIDKYYEKENYVYFVGYYHKQRVFCKLNIENNLLIYYSENGNDYITMDFASVIKDKQVELLSSFEDFSEEDKIEFEILTNN